MMTRIAATTARRIVSQARTADCVQHRPPSLQRPSPSRLFAAAAATHDTDAKEWRKQQLDKLEQKFQQRKRTPSSSSSVEITNDDDLQPMWKAMESRVTKRRTLTKEEAGVVGKTGRQNIKKTDEEAWLQAGLYNNNDDNNNDTEPNDNTNNNNSNDGEPK